MPDSYEYLSGRRRMAMKVAESTPAHSETTRRIYDTQYRQYIEWCEAEVKWDEQAPAYPTEAVVAYLEARAERGICSSTLWVTRCAIAAHARAVRLPDPTDHESVRRLLHRVRKLRKGDRRQATGTHQGSHEKDFPARHAEAVGDALVDARLPAAPLRSGQRALERSGARAGRLGASHGALLQDGPGLARARSCS